MYGPNPDIGIVPAGIAVLGREAVGLPWRIAGTLSFPSATSFGSFFVECGQATRRRRHEVATPLNKKVAACVRFAHSGEHGAERRAGNFWTLTESGRTKCGTLRRKKKSALSAPPDTVEMGS